MARQQKYHILFLDTNDAMGGVVRVHSHLLDTFDRDRFEVTLACQRCGPLHAGFGERTDLRCLPLNVGTKAVEQCGGLKSLAYNVIGFGVFVGAILRLAMYCRRESVDVVYTSDKKRSVLLALVVSKLAGRSLVYHIHNVYVDYRANRTALARAAGIIANSGAMKQDFIRHLGPAMERIRVIHNGLDPDEFRPLDASPLRRELEIPDSAIVVGVTTRLAPEKGHETLLKALAAAHAEVQLRLVVVGDTSIYSNNAAYVQQLYDQTENLGLREFVTFLGYRTDMVDIYNGLDIVVDPAWEEAFGMVVIEPMACGKCVLGTAAGGIPEIIRDGENGFLFPPRDADALATLLVRIARMPATERRRFGEAARQTVLERFTIEKQTRAVEHILAPTL